MPHSPPKTSDEPPPPADAVGGTNEFDGVDSSKFTLTSFKTQGHFDFRKLAPEIEVRGKSIAKGIKKFKENPQKYIAITFQASMLGWPSNQQEYNLILRAGTEGLAPCDVGDDGWMKVMMWTYHHLPPFPNNELPMEDRDPWTDTMTHRGRLLHDGNTHKPILPGRGMGIGDSPLLKTIGDIDPSGASFVEIGVELCFCVSDS